jgi:hypothetical protein
MTRRPVAHRPVRRDVVEALGLRRRVTPDGHFRKTGTGFDRKPGIKWLRCTVK